MIVLVIIIIVFRFSIYVFLECMDIDKPIVLPHVFSDTKRTESVQSNNHVIKS